MKTQREIDKDRESFFLLRDIKVLYIQKCYRQHILL
jgi:hypothetical protein